VSEPSPLERQLVQEKEDLEAVLSTAAGRRFVWGCIERSGVFGHSFRSDTHETAFAEGRRAEGIWLMVRVQEEAPKRWLEMLSEAAAARL
jgi:hypothetical protein